MQGLQHALAHFLRSAAREREREDALRGVDACEQTQISLRQQCRLSGTRGRLYQDRPGRLDRVPTSSLIDGLVNHLGGPPSSNAAGTRHNVCRSHDAHARSVGATSACPAANSPARASPPRWQETRW